MIILIIFLVIIALFILIGMIRINLHFSLSEDKEFDCFVKILFFKIKLLPSSGGKINKKKSRVKKNINKNANNKDDKKDALKNNKKHKKGFIEILKNVKIYIEALPKFLKKLLRGVKIKNLSVVWCISTDDACETALQYARCCGCFYNLFRIVKSICNVKVDKIRIFPDFINENSYCVVFLRLQISIGRLLICVLGYLVTTIIKSLINKEKERLK